MPLQKLLYVAFIHQFCNGRGACVRSNEGGCSEMFEVEKEDSRGMRTLSALVNIFLAATLLIAIQSFIFDWDILAGLVHLHDLPTDSGLQTTQDHAMRVSGLYCTCKMAALCPVNFKSCKNPTWYQIPIPTVISERCGGQQVTSW